MAVPINVCAANQKIKVNPVYQNSKVIKGKTKKRYRVQAKIGKKKYQTKADCKGKCWKELLYQGISRKEIYFKEENPCINKIHKGSKVFNKK